MDPNLNQPEQVAPQVPQIPPNNGKNPKTLIITICVAVVILLAGGLGWYLMRDKATPNQNIQINNQNNMNENQKSPSGIYLKMKEEMSKVTNYEEYTSVIKNYFSEKLLATELAPAADYEKELKLALIKEMPQSDKIKISEEKIDDNKAELTVLSTENKSTGKVKMVLEDEQWKISGENWSLDTSAYGKNYENLKKTVEAFVWVLKEKSYHSMYSSYVCPSSKSKLSEEKFVAQFQGWDIDLAKDFETVDIKFNDSTFLSDNNLKSLSEVESSTKPLNVNIVRIPKDIGTANMSNKYPFQFEGGNWCYVAEEFE
jgi:hypothetical protein